MDTKNILFICGGAFDGVEKIIEKRVNQKGIGFGAEIMSKAELEKRNILSQIQPHDLLKFGIIPELVGRLPVITSLSPLSREDLVKILTEPKNALVKQYQKLLEYDMVKLVFTPGAWRPWPISPWNGGSVPEPAGGAGRGHDPGDV